MWVTFHGGTPLAEQALAERVRDHHDPVRGAIDESLQVLGRAERASFAHQPSRGGGIGNHVLQPQDPGESAKASAGQHREQAEERRRDRHRRIRGRGKRGGHRRRGRIGRLLHDPLGGCAVADHEREAEDRDAVSRLPVGTGAATPERARIVRMRGDDLHLMPARAHRLRPPGRDRPHRCGLGLVVPAP